MTALTLDEVFVIDPTMVGRLHPNEYTQFIVFYNITIDGICAGTMMFLYSDKSMVDYGAVTTCGSRIENIVVSALRSRNSNNYNKKKRI